MRPPAPRAIRLAQRREDERQFRRALLRRPVRGRHILGLAALACLTPLRPRGYPALHGVEGGGLGAAPRPLLPPPRPGGGGGWARPCTHNACLIPDRGGIRPRCARARR